MGINVKALSKSNIWRLDLLMILVALGTQDRSFKRLLEAVDKQIELGNIKERVVVQAGVTKYQSDNMEIFDLIPSDEFLKLLKECSVLICHGGVGTIIDALKCHKKVIAAARLKEYGEHQNNHQKQIINEFTKKKLILELDDFSLLDKKLKEIETFTPGEYESNTNHFIDLLNGYIESSIKDNQGNVQRKFMQYLFYACFLFLLLFLFFEFFSIFSLSFFNKMFFVSFFIIFYRFLIHFIFLHESGWNILGEFIFYIIFGLQNLFVFTQIEFFHTFCFGKLFGLYWGGFF